MHTVDRDADARFNEASLAEQLAWYTQEGLVTVPVDLGQALDTSFVRAAAECLGSYP
jgi:hypothetical protein